MVVRQAGERTQIAVLEDGVLVEHYVEHRQRSVLRRQRLPRQGAERPAVDGGGVRRHRQGPQRRPLRRRGQLGRGRAGGPAAAHRAGAEVRRPGPGPGHQGPDRPQGRPADQPDLPARPLPGLRARRLDDRHQPQAARHRARPAQGDPQEGRARGRRRHRPHRRRGRQRGGARPRRRPAAPRSGRTSRRRRKARQRAGAALRRAGPDHPGRPRHLQRGLHLARRLRRRRLGHASRRTSSTSPRTCADRLSPLDRRARTSSPRTASTSSSPRRSTARSGCPAAARWSSTAPRR